MNFDTANSALSTLSIEDLDHTFSQLPESTWRLLDGRRIFITGGTGFVGKWLLATIIDVIDRLNLNCEITVLSRNPEKFKQAMPAIAKKIDFISGDVKDFTIPKTNFDTVIHAATDVQAKCSPSEIFETCVDGTRRVLELVKQCGTTDFLLISSGAIYGPHPKGMTHVPESHLGGPNTLSGSSAYAEGKRVSEWLSCVQDSGANVKIARVFALIGPYLPLEGQFAIGNFLKAALTSDKIVIEGDGTPYRSYLHASDMAAWLWAVLLKGASGTAYNVGSSEELTISDLAERIVSVLGVDTQIQIKTPPIKSDPQYYVPDNQKILSELSLKQPLKLNDSIDRTAAWLKKYLRALDIENSI